MDQSNTKSKPQKPKKRRNRKVKKKTDQPINGHETKQFVIQDQTSNRKMFDHLQNQSTSSPRPVDLGKNNFNFDTKRCSGSEFEEYHTPNYEYPELSQNDEMENSYKKEWEEIGSFNKSNLHGIPEQDNYSNTGSNDLRKRTKETSSPVEEIPSLQTKFKYKQIKTRKTKKCNGSVVREINGKTSKDINTDANKDVAVNSFICSENNSETVGHVDDNKSESEEIIDYLDQGKERFNEILAESGQDNVIDSEIIVDSDIICCISNNDEDTCTDEINGKCIVNVSKENQFTHILDSEEVEFCQLEQKQLLENYEDNDKYEGNTKLENTMEDSDNEIQVEEVSITESITKPENDGIANHLESQEIEHIHCIDENLESEILPVPKHKLEIIYMTHVKKSMTFVARTLDNSHRQSATTITNVTSISDENINLTYESDSKRKENDKKRNRFVKKIFAKFKKRKPVSNSAANVEPKPQLKDKLPENNEYFDDASIDCGSQAKGLEVDSNKALKSYDDSINNFEDSKPNQEDNDNERETHSLHETVTVMKNDGDYLVPQTVDNVSETDNVFYEETRSEIETPLKHTPKSEQLDVERKSVKSDSHNSHNEDNTLEKPKKNNFFNSFLRKNNKKKSKSPRKESFQINDKGDVEVIEIINSEIKVENKTLFMDVDSSKSVSTHEMEITIPVQESYEEMESLNRSFKFLYEFDSDFDKGNLVVPESNLVEENCPSLDVFVTESIPVNQNQVAIEADIPNQEKESENKIAQIDIISDFPNSISVTEKRKRTRKRKFWTLFANKKNNQITIETKPRSLSNENLKIEDKKENVLKHDPIKVDEEQIEKFNEIVNSFQSVLETDEKVLCKNKNEYPIRLAEESVTVQSVCFVNDDHMFPDAITPSKIVVFESRESYNFPFIDDPIIEFEDSLTMFKGETRKLMLFSEFSSAPFASLETLFISENNKYEVPEKSLSPLRSNKRPLSGLLGCLSRSR